MLTIVLADYPRMSRWMRGTIVNNKRDREMKTYLLYDDVLEIVTEWFSTYFSIETHSFTVDALYFISNFKTQKRIELFLSNVRMYDIRIIHMRIHNTIAVKSFLKVQIAFKRQHLKVYDKLRLFVDISFD